MPGGFLLQDDAVDAAKTNFDNWVKEQQDKARQAAAAATQAAQTAAAPVTQAVQDTSTALSDQVNQAAAEAQARFDAWTQQQSAANRDRSVAPPEPTPSTPSLTAPNPTAVGQGATPGERFDDWVRQQHEALAQAAAPAVSAVQSAGQGLQDAVSAGAQKVDQAVNSASGGTALNQSQFGDPQLTSSEAYAACGPAAAVRFAQMFGRNPTLREATDIAATVGWTSQNGMAGISSEKALMDKLGVQTHIVGADWSSIAKEAQTGNPVTISTPGHYFMADGYDPGSGAFHVGRSGLDLRGGKEWMTPNEMEGRMGALQGALFADNPTIPSRSAASGTGAPGSPTAPVTAALQTGQPPTNVKVDSSSPDAFFSSLMPAAQYIQDKTGINAASMLAIVANETGYGRSDNARDKNNLFSIQGDGSNGSRWASYGSALDSFQAFADLISKAPRYAQAWADRADPRKFIDDLRTAGYVADEPGYPAQGWVDQVKGIIDKVPETAQAAVDTTRSTVQGAFNSAVAGTGAVAQGAQAVQQAGQSQLDALRAQTDKAAADFQAAQQAADEQSRKFREGLNQQISQTQADIFKPRDYSGLADQARQAGQDILNTPVAQAAGQALSNAPTPFNPSQTLGQTGEAIANLPENVSNVAQGLVGANTEAERQQNQDSILTSAARVGANLAGRDLAPETAAAINQATPPMLQMPDVGGVVSQFLKSGNIVPASQTVDLPVLGPTPIADIIGLASNLVIPTGMEERFATSASQRALDRAAFEAAQASRATGGLGGLLERPGSQAAWAAALGSKIGEGSTAAKLAMSGVGRWARASVQDIANDLASGPIGNLLRDESGTLNVDRLTEVAQKIKSEMVRVYSGTVGEYDRADLARANPEGLYGPGYYTTDDPRIAGGLVTEPESGWAARYGRAENGFDYGRIFPTQAEARADAVKQRADMLAQYSGLKPADVPMPIIVQRSKEGGMVEAEGYAQAAGTRAGLGDQGTLDAYHRNISRLEQQIAETQKDIELEPYARERERLQQRLGDYQNTLELQQDGLERALNQKAGPAVRPLNVPRNLNLLNMDEGMSARELTDLAEHAAERGMPQTERVLSDQALTSMRNYPPTGDEVYNALQHEAGLSKTQIQEFLESAGYHGIQHEGGAIRPMLDEAGEPIRHTTRVLFQSGLDRSQNLAGGAASAVPNAAIGGAAGAGTGDEDTTPQERLYRGLGGAFVAGALRNKNPAVAAFEAQALRKGATATEIANAVQTARKEAGKAWKFAGPIADAANAAFKAAPGADQIVAARQMLRDFGDKATLLRAAPPNAQTDSGAARLHNMLMEMARQGESQRFWYTNASDAINEAAQGDKQKAEKLAQLFAIYSPGATVSANTQMALAAWHQFLEGVPINVGKGQLDEKAQKLLYDNVPWEGRKTNNFYRNLMKRIDPDVWQSMGKEDGQTGTTVDIWMMRALKYLQDAPSMGEKGQYEFAQRAIERVAKDLGWQPDEAQAAIWSAMKAADEGTSLQEAGYHYGTGLAQRAGRVGELEPTPGIQGTLQRVFGLFGQEGAPALPAEKGSRTLYDEAGNAIRNKAGEAVSENIPENKGMISQAANQTVSAYAAARAWLEKLPEISWARVFPDNKPTLRDSNALVVDVGRPLSDAELSQLRSKLPDTVSVTQTDNGAWIINHDGSHVRTPNVPGAPKEENLAGQWVGSNNRDFHKQADAAVRSLDTVQEASTYPLRADSTTLRNDWSQAPNGEDYAHVINGSARAGAFWDVADPLARRVADTTGADASHAAAVPELRGGAPPSRELPGGVPGAADIGPTSAAADVGRATDTGAAAAEAGAAGGAERASGAATANGAPGGLGGAVRDFLTGPESEAGSISLGAMSRLGGAGLGVASQEATMSEQDKQDPWGRFSRDIGAGILGAVAPNVAGAAIRGGVNYRDLSGLRPPQQAPLVTAAGKGSTAAQNISAFTKQNLLSGPKTHVTNIISQLVELAHMPLSNLAAGHEEDAVAGIRAAGQAVPDAMRNFANTMRTGQTQFTQAQGVTSKWLPALRLLGATDDFFRTIGWAMGAGQEGQRILRESGAGAAGASSVLGGASARINAAGDKAASMSVFSEGGAAGGDAISRLKTKLMGSASYKDQVLGLMLDAGVPFSSVPGRIWNTALKRMPLVSEVSAVAKAVTAVKAGDTYAFQKAMGDAAISSVIDASIISNIANGNIRGPDDKEHPSGIKLNGQWYDYSGWGAWTLPIALPASYYESVRAESNKPNADYVKAIFDASGKALESQFYAADIMKVLSQVGSGNGSGAAGQLVGSYVDRYLPAGGALNQATALWDPIMRDTSQKFPQAIWEREQAKVPGLESLLPARPEMTSGQPQERLSSGAGQLLGMQTRSISPLDATIADLQRKNYKISDPTQAPTSITLRGNVVPLSEAESRALAVKRGQLINDALGQMAASPGWDKLSDNDKAMTLNRVMARIDSRNAALWADMTPSAEIDRRLAAGHTVAGKLQPTPTPALAGRR